MKRIILNLSLFLLCVFFSSLGFAETMGLGVRNIFASMSACNQYRESLIGQPIYGTNQKLSGSIKCRDLLASKGYFQLDHKPTESFFASCDRFSYTNLVYVDHRKSSTTCLRDLDEDPSRPVETEISEVPEKKEPRVFLGRIEGAPESKLTSTSSSSSEVTEVTEGEAEASLGGGDTIANDGGESSIKLTEAQIDLLNDESSEGESGDDSEGDKKYKQSENFTKSSMEQCGSVSGTEECNDILNNRKTRDANGNIIVLKTDGTKGKMAEDEVTELEKIRAQDPKSDSYEPGRVSVDNLTIDDIDNDATYFAHQRGCQQYSDEESKQECLTGATQEALAANCSDIAASDLNVGEEDKMLDQNDQIQDAKTVCKKYAREDQAMRQKLTEGQIPNDFYDLMNNQGLTAFYDPDLPKSKYINTKEGTVAWPEQVCGSVAPSKNNKSIKGIGPATRSSELQSQSLSFCEVKEAIGDGGFTMSGEFSKDQEKMLCTHARATECPKLNYVFDNICNNAFVQPSDYNSEDFYNEPQETFRNAFCGDSMKAFLNFIAQSIMKELDKQQYETNPNASLDANWSGAARKYGLTEVQNPTTVKEWYALAEEYSGKVNEKPIVAVGSTVEEGVEALNDGCVKGCKKMVMNEATSKDLFGTEGQGGKLGQKFGPSLYNELGESAVEDGLTDPLFSYKTYDMPKGLAACTREAYAYRRNVYVGHCTAYRAMARYGTEDDMAEAAGDTEMTSFDGQFTCIRRSVYTVDYESCKTLLGVYSAGQTTELVGQQVEQAGTMIKGADIQDKVAKQQAEGDPTAALEGMRAMNAHKRDTETVKATFYGINTAALGGAMSAFVTPSKIEDNCASELGPYAGYRCLQAAHLMVNDDPALRSEFFPNQEIHDRFYGVIMQTFGKGLVAGLMAHMYGKRAKYISKAKKKFARPDSANNRGFYQDDFCLQNPLSNMCNGGPNGRVQRDGIQFGGISSSGLGGDDVDFRNDALGEYQGDDNLSPAEKKRRENLRDIMGSGGAKKIGKGFNKIGGPKVKVGSSGAGGGNTKAGDASASGGTSGGGGASAQGGSRRSAPSQSKMTIGGNGKGFKTFSGRGGNKKRGNKNAFAGLIGNKRGRKVANLDLGEKIHPKNIGLFDKISQRYSKVNGENRLEKQKVEGKK